MSLHFTETQGDGETTVFLHGLGTSGWMWTDQLEALAREAHCVNVDLPGNGESHVVEWTSFADTADQVARLVRSVARGGKAHVVGLSLGGYVGIYLLARHPDVVRTLLVSGVTTRPFRPAWFWGAVTRLIATASGFDLVAKLSARAMQLPEDVVPLYLRDARRLSSATIRRVYDEVLDFSLPASLADLETPVLAVAGSAEAQRVLSSLADFEQSCGNAQTAIAPDAHHAWNAEHPELFTAMIRAWTRGEELPETLERRSAPASPRETRLPAAS